jgi:hypothetical protein
MADEKKRNYLAISSISMLGSCEVKFYDTMFTPRVVTRKMQIGTDNHRKMVEKLPGISKEQMLSDIRNGKSCAFREVFVLDQKLKTIGRMDEIRFQDGFAADGRRRGILIDDKFTRANYGGIPLYYRLQLAAYACAVENSPDFSGICTMEKAMLVCRNSVTRQVTRVFEADEGTVGVWKSNTPEAIADGWRIYNKEKAPEHRRFDVENGEWIGCYCDSA